MNGDICFSINNFKTLFVAGRAATCAASDHAGLVAMEAITSWTTGPPLNATCDDCQNYINLLR